MLREIRSVTTAILNFKMAFFTLNYQFTVLLSLKLLKAANPINKHFKISNYENELVFFLRWRLFAKWPPLNYLKLSTHSIVSVIKHDILIRMKDFAMLKCSQAHHKCKLHLSLFSGNFSFN